MRRMLTLFITIGLVLSLSACGNGETGFIEISKTNINQKENSDEQAEVADFKTNTTNKKGLAFPQYSATTEYDGYTYELVNKESSTSDSSNKYSDTLIYRYTQSDDKQQWHILDNRNYNCN